MEGWIRELRLTQKSSRAARTRQSGHSHGNHYVHTAPVASICQQGNAVLSGQRWQANLQKVCQEPGKEGGLWGLSCGRMGSAGLLGSFYSLGLLLGQVAPVLCQHLLGLQLQLQQWQQSCSPPWQLPLGVSQGLHTSPRRMLRSQLQ